MADRELTVQEAAEYMQVNPKTLSRWEDAGELTGRMVHETVPMKRQVKKYRLSDLQRLQQARGGRTKPDA